LNAGVLIFHAGFKYTFRQMIKQTLFLSLLLISCSQQLNDELPEYLKELDNLAFFQTNQDVPLEILFNNEKIIEDQKKMIGRPGRILIDDSGRIVIEESTYDKAALLAFSEDGYFIHEISRRGQGPGEFISIFSIQYRFNRLFVHDAGMQRLHVFSTESDSFPLVNTILYQFDSWNHDEILKNRKSPNTVFIRSDKNIFSGFIDPIDYEQDNSQLKDLKKRYYLLDQYGKAAEPFKLIFESRAAGYLNLNPTIYQFPFLRKSLMAISKNDEIYDSWSEDFLIKVYSPDGNYQRAIYYPVKKRSLNRDDILLKKYLEEKEETARSDPRLMAGHRERKRVLTEVMPGTWPALDDLLIDDKDRLWVSTITDDSDTYDWWVLQNTGELITKFTWPRNRQIEVVKYDKVYVRETDPVTGLQQVVRYGFELEAR